MLREGTQRYISALSDEQLLEYLVVGTRQYELDAVKFAQEEFQRRGLSGERLAGLAGEARERVLARELENKTRAESELGRGGKILWFFLGFLNLVALPLYLIISAYVVRGEVRKARAMRIALVWGFAVEMLLVAEFVGDHQWFGPFSIAAVLVAAGYVFDVAMVSERGAAAAGFEVVVRGDKQSGER